MTPPDSRSTAQFARMAICLAACLAASACSSLERFTDRQVRHFRYNKALRALPERATRADIYTALPPQTMPAPPPYFSIMGVGAMATEHYPLDADFQVFVPILYARSDLICRRWWSHFNSRVPDRLTRTIQSPHDMIFGAQPTIESRHTTPPLL